MVRRCKLLVSCRWIVLVLLLSNCALPRAPATPVIGDDLDAESLRAAIRHSLAYLERLPAERVVGMEPRHRGERGANCVNDSVGAATRSVGSTSETASASRRMTNPPWSTSVLRHEGRVNPSSRTGNPRAGRPRPSGRARDLLRRATSWLPPRNRFRRRTEEFREVQSARGIGEGVESLAASLRMIDRRSNVQCRHEALQSWGWPLRRPGSGGRSTRPDSRRHLPLAFEMVEGRSTISRVVVFNSLATRRSIPPSRSMACRSNSGWILLRRAGSSS